MKRLLLALTIVALVLPAIPRARAADVSVDFFYNNLSGGSWIEVADYGYCWQPDVAVSAGWRPYADGYWAYTDLGWTWVSYEDFGWATYHYGRWVRLHGRGWVWVPGRDEDLEWGPAWVSWRTGGDHIGWAPLPPRRRGISFVAGARIFGRVDIDFDIGPEYYNFVDVRYIGEPVLRDRIYQTSQNVTYINQTVNVTNITYQDNRFYNYGPDYNTLSTRSSRPIQRLKIEQQTNVDAGAAVKSGTLTKVEGDRLVVAAPTTIKKSTQPIAPPKVKEKIAQAKVDDGWAVSDPKQKEELKKKMQTEDNKKIPPPTTGASAGAQAGASASPAGSAGPGVSASPGAKGKGKAKVGEQLQPAGSASPAASASAGVSTSPGASASPFGKGKGKNKFEQPGASIAPGASVAPVTTPDLGKSGKGKRGELQTAPTPAGGFSPATEATIAPGGKSKGKFERGNLGVTPSPGETSTELPKGKGKSQLERGNLGPTPSTEGSTELPKANAKPKFERGNLGPTPATEGSTEMPNGKGKAKQFEPMGTPSGGGTESPMSGAPAGGKYKAKQLETAATPPTGGAGAPMGGAPTGGGKHKGGETNVQSPVGPTGAGPAAPEGGKGKAAPEGEKGKGKGKKGEESPAPTP